MDVILYLVVFYLGCKFGEITFAFRIRHQLLKLESEENELIETRTEIKKLVTEKVDNSILLYEVGTHTFICQGSTLDELATLSKSYKNIKIAAVHHNDEFVWFVDGTVKKKI
jgi:hypothetical protein